MFLNENKPKIIKNGKFIFLLKKLYLIFPKEINNNNFIENEYEIFTLTKLFEFKNLNKIPNSNENFILIKNIQNIFNFIYNLFNFRKKENYKINLFTENFQNLENDNQLFFYKNNIIYAKINKLFNNFHIKIYENHKNQLKNNQINYNENYFVKNYYNFIKNKKISNSFIINNSNISIFKQNDKNKKFNNIQSIFQSKNSIKKINKSCSTMDLNNYIENNNKNNNKNNNNFIKINKNNNNFFSKKKFLNLKKYNNNNFFKTFNLSFQKNLNKIEYFSKFSNKNKSTNYKNKSLIKIKKFLFPNFLFKEETKQNEKIKNKIKEEYLILILFLRKNLKNIDNLIKNENFINENLFLTDLNFNKKYEKFFPFKNCIKEFIFYSFINENCDELLKIIYNLNDENNFEKNEINENFNKIKTKIIDLINNENLLNNFINKKLKTKEIKISKKFFEIFILCSNYFDGIQSKISHIFLIIFNIDNFVYFSNFCYYYLYFKNSNLLTNENKILFVKKFFNLFKINKNSNENLNTEIIKLFKIENKLFNFLLFENNFINDNEKLNIKIINIFNKIINYFNNFSFQN